MKTIYYLLDELHGLAALARLFAPNIPIMQSKGLDGHTGAQERACPDIHSPAIPAHPIKESF